ncbi:MAG: RNase adaptor protein RapZ, partial [Rhodospirillaceae bacterium]|nr:RNase adaptor protein RapZ [Rhodospirillaceae bacterium]
MAEPEIGEDQNRRQLVLITGLAGAGRSTALKALEDEGYEAIDN